MKNQFFQLSIRTPDGQFIASYSTKGLAELKFPSVGRASPRAVKKEIVPTQILRWHRAVVTGLKSSLAGRKPKNLPPLDLAGTEFQKRTAENFRWQNEKLRRNRAGNRQAKSRSRRWRRLRGEPDTDFCAVPSCPRREQKTGRFFRRIGLETRFARARRCQNLIRLKNGKSGRNTRRRLLKICPRM